MAFIDFNAQQVPEDTGPEPLPAGDYLIYVESSELRQEDDGTQKLSMVAKVIQPEHFAGRTLFPSFTMYSSNTSHVQTGQRLLALVCRAVGVIHPRDSEELHDKPFWTRVVPKASSSGKVYSNMTTFWSTASQAPPPPKTAPRAPVAPAPAHPARTGYAPPQQAWQQPAPPQVAPQQQYAPPAQPMAQPQLDLQTQYRTAPAPQQYAQPPQQQYAPPQGAPAVAPPWTRQQAPQQAPPQQQYAPPRERQPGEDDQGPTPF